MAKSKKVLSIPDETWPALKALFAEGPVRSAAEVEQALMACHKDYRDKRPMEMEGGRPKRRTRGENLCDWVKAHLTQGRQKDIQLLRLVGHHY